MKVLYLSLVVVIIDQVSKLLIKGFNIPFLKIHHSGVRINQSIKIIDDFFKITHVENYGLAFGIDFGRNLKVVLTLITIFAALLILLYLYVSRQKAFQIRFAIALIFGGALGNIIDRTFYGILYKYAPLFHGRVVDFIHIDIFDYNLFGKTYESLPIFNIADLAVFTGLLILLFYSVKFKYAKVENDEMNDNFTLKEKNKDTPIN